VANERRQQLYLFTALISINPGVINALPRLCSRRFSFLLLFD